MLRGRARDEALRERFRAGSTKLPARLLLVALALAAAPAVARAALPADYPLELLQLGSRPDLALGGDPFLSRLEGQAGWWRRPLLDRDRAVSLRQGSSSPITRRLTRNKMLLDRTVVELVAQDGWTARGRRLQVQLAGTWGTAHHALRTSQSRVDAEDNGTAYRGLARLTGLLPGLDLQAEAPLGGASCEFTETPVRYGLRYRFRDRIRVEAHRSLSTCSPGVAARVESELVDSPLNLRARELNYGARIRIWRTVAVESRVHETTVEPDRGLSGSSGYAFLPDGSGAFREHEIGAGRAAGRRVLARYTHLRARGSAQGYLSGERYLLFNYGEANLTTWSGAVQIPVQGASRLLVDFAHTEGDAFGRAKVESWPFLSWQEAWINGSKIAQVSADGRMQRYHVGYERLRTRGSLSAGLSWYEIHPNATVDSWTKVVFGKTDRVVTHLATRRVSLGAVSVGGSLACRGVGIDLGLHQFVYANDHVEKPKVVRPGPPIAVSGWFGGTYAEATLTYRP